MMRAFDFATSPRATSWRLRTRKLAFGKRPLVMGIVNVTPDSFSDGGRFLNTDRAIEHAIQLVRDGADLLDIGGESTRPYSEPVSEEEELRRVVPVIRALAKCVDVPISVDTSKARVAEASLDAGAEIINDVTGLCDGRIIEVARKCDAGVCVMHMQGTPQTMQDKPMYSDVVADIYDYLRGRLQALVAAGIDRDRICLDPGIGFGKTHQHNVTLMAHCWRFHELGQPLLVGHSPKGSLASCLATKRLTERREPSAPPVRSRPKACKSSASTTCERCGRHSYYSKRLAESTARRRQSTPS